MSDKDKTRLLMMLQSSWYLPAPTAGR
jgi:hypothetical protein